MTRFSIALALVSLIVAMVQPASAVTVSGKNQWGQYYSNTFNTNGTLTAKSTKTDGSCCMYDTGRWWMEGGKRCHTYNTWQPGKTFCH